MAAQSPALWKQEADLHPTFQPLNNCLADDWFLLAYELRLQRAHAAALQAAGILTDAERAALDAALDRLAGETDPKHSPASDAEDLHTWIESRLTELAGPAGRKIHTGRSRNDQVATLLRLYVLEQATRLAERLGRLVNLLSDRAAAWAEYAMPLQTHTQFAAPGSAGFWVLRYAVGFNRLRERARELIERWRRDCPLGSGAVAGTSIPLDRRLQASVLGFEGPGLNALDATTTRDDCLEFLMLAAHIGLHYQSWATDVILYSQTPLGWVDYPREFATGSSMMPNKLNPDAMELLRGESSELQGALAQVLILLKGLPSGYNRDLQGVKPVLRRAAEKLLALTDLLLAFCERLDFHPAALRAALARGHVDATLRMEARVRAGLPLREAHHATAAELRDLPDEIPPDQQPGIDHYQTLGSANPDEVRRVAALLRAAAGA